MQTATVALAALAFSMGVIAGLRAMMPLAAVSWAATLGWLTLDGTALAFLGFRWTPWIATALALGELVTDQLPSTPSRLVPIQFATRLLTGGLAGAGIGGASGWMLVGAAAGVMGAALGTMGGHAFRGRLAAAFRKDRPAALIEDAIAVAGAVLLVVSLS